MHRTEDFYESPCNRKCKVKKFWLMQVEGMEQQINLTMLLICLGCIHFERRDHYIPDIDD